MRRFRDLAAPPDLAPETGRWFAALEALRLATIDLVQDIDADRLRWAPAPGTNSIGTLLTHLAESEAFWIVERVGGRPLPASRREIYRMDHFGDPQAPQAPRAPVSYFIGLLEEARMESREVLAGLNDPDLDGKRVWVDPARPDEQEVFTVRWVLQHVLTHEAHHAGQIALIRTLLGLPSHPSRDA